MAKKITVYDSVTNECAENVHQFYNIKHKLKGEEEKKIKSLKLNRLM